MPFRALILSLALSVVYPAFADSSSKPPVECEGGEAACITACSNGSWPAIKDCDRFVNVKFPWSPDWARHQECLELVYKQREACQAACKKGFQDSSLEAVEEVAE